LISVLIIEDDAEICELLMEQLTRCNYLTVCRSCGSDALHWLETNTPSLMVLNYSLPDMNGKEFITQLRETHELIPPFIIAAEQGNEKIAVEMMKLGAKDYITRDRAFLDLLPEVIKHIEKEISSEGKLKLAREQLWQSRKMEAIAKLARRMAHDFNNILTGILGASCVLQKRMTEDKEAQDFLKIIIESSERAADLTAKLLVFGGEGESPATPVDLHQMITDTAALLERRISKKISIQCECNAIQQTIPGDCTLLQSALLNMGINADQAMDSGGTLTYATQNIFLDETLCNESSFDIKPGTYLQITVRDTGTGITPENLRKIFVPFYTTRTESEGRGLGLSTVYGTVKQHHGSITVQSKVGSGTSFYVHLPIAE